MRILLDTHAFLWWLAGSLRLVETARRAIADDGNDVLVSAVSAWEIATKYRSASCRRRMRWRATYATPLLARARGFEELSIGAGDAARAGAADRAHVDRAGGGARLPSLVPPPAVRFKRAGPAVRPGGGLVVQIVGPEAARRAGWPCARSSGWPRSQLAADGLSRAVCGQDPMLFWKSVPYLAHFMHGIQIRYLLNLLITLSRFSAT